MADKVCFDCGNRTTENLRKCSKCGGNFINVSTGTAKDNMTTNIGCVVLIIICYFLMKLTELPFMEPIKDYVVGGFAFIVFVWFILRQGK